MSRADSLAKEFENNINKLQTVDKSIKESEEKIKEANKELEGATKTEADVQKAVDEYYVECRRLIDTPCPGLKKTSWADMADEEDNMTAEEKAKEADDAKVRGEKHDQLFISLAEAGTARLRLEKLICQMKVQLAELKMKRERLAQESETILRDIFNADAEASYQKAMKAAGLPVQTRSYSSVVGFQSLSSPSSLSATSGASVVSAASAKSHVPCRFFPQGRCNKGASCPFSHVPPAEHVKTAICNKFARGDCPDGDACQFAHGPEQLQVDPRAIKTKLCRDFENFGKCPRGNICTFAHGENELQEAQEFRNPSTAPCPPSGEAKESPELLEAQTFCPTWARTGKCVTPNCSFTHPDGLFACASPSSTSSQFACASPRSPSSCASPSSSSSSMSMGSSHKSKSPRECPQKEKSEWCNKGDKCQYFQKGRCAFAHRWEEKVCAEYIRGECDKTLTSGVDLHYRCTEGIHWIL